MRQCVGCREMKPKIELIRVLKTADEGIVIDKTGKKNGRGAYLCKNVECLEKAIKSRGLNRTLKISKIDNEIYEELRKQLEDGNE